MNQRCINVLDEVDWETTILEVGTADSLEGLNELQSVCDAIYPVLRVAAKNWLYQHSYNTNSVEDLVSIAFQAYVSVREKYTPPNTDNEGILKSFKAWCCRVAENEWEHNRAKDIDSEMVDYNDELEAGDNEEYYSSALTKCQKQILLEELEKIPGNMKECLLDQAAVKSSRQQNKRGLKGEAKRIAEQYGCTESAIRKRRSRLFESIKTRASKECK